MKDMLVRDYFGLGATHGQLGIEIEAEVKKPFVQRDSYLSYWRTEGDGSLRNIGVEMVLRKPCNLDELPARLEAVSKTLASNGNKILPTIRAGVHVHLNMQEHPIGDLFKLMAVYYPLETMLTRFCGDGREGNLFCLRTKDAGMFVRAVEGVLDDWDLSKINDSAYRYASMNFQSLFQYGSVEFRGLGTTPDLNKIVTWATILLKLRDYACKVESSWDNIAKISGDGAEAYVKEIFGPDLTKLLYYDGAEEDIIDDLRGCQMLCHKISKQGL